MTFVIAEAGVNHNGRLLTALELVDAALEAGADAVKFQMFDSHKLWGDDRIKHLELTQQEFEIIAEHCDGIEFMCTPFGVEGLKRCVDLGVRRIKISSGLMTDLDLLLAAKERRLPLVISTGMSTFAEMMETYLFCKPAKMTFLQCVSSYPAPLEETNLLALRHFPIDAGVGLSDHTRSLAIPAAAVALGAEVIEKHLTLDRDQDGPDHKASLEPEEFAQMVNGIREVEKAMGDGIKRVMPSEESLRKVWRDRR